MSIDEDDEKVNIEVLSEGFHFGTRAVASNGTFGAFYRVENGPATLHM